MIMPPAYSPENAVLFLTEAGEGIGFGHLTRMSALQAYLEKAGVPTEMKAHIKGSLANVPYAVPQVNWLEMKLSALTQVTWGTIVVDSYLAPESRYLELKSLTSRLIAIDDYQRLHYPTDIVINPSLAYNATAYRGQSARCFGGSKYLIFRRAFQNVQDKTCATVPNSILVTTGGSDSRRLLLKIAELSSRFSEITLIAPEATVYDEVSSKFPSVRVLGILDEYQMREEYNRAELVIAACGQSMNELALLGKNTVGLITGDDQKQNANYYEASGFLRRTIAWDDPDFFENVFKAVIDEIKRIRSGKTVSKLNIDPHDNMRNYYELMVNR